MRAPASFAWLLLAGALTAQGKIDFQTQVLPILQRSCFECHSTAAPGPDGKLKKPKGGLTLDTKDGMHAKAALLAPKNPGGSLLYERITKPADDDDRMPPAKKGDPLPKAQIDVIKQWIEEGASLGTWTGKKTESAPAEKPADKPAGAGKDKEKDKEKVGAAKPKVDPLLELQKGVKAVPPATLAALANGPFLVASIGDNSPLLSVGSHGNADSIDDKALAALAPIAANIAELDLSRTRVGDEGCKTIATMPRLVTLDLRQSAVGNQGLVALAGCKELRTLNLFGTKAGDYGMAALAALKHLEQLYVWQTEVSAEAVVRLREAIPGLRVVIAAEMPDAMPEGQGNGRRRK